MEALEVGNLRLVPGIDKRVEPGFDQIADTAAQHCLLAEQVGLRLLLERRAQHAGSQ
jgi:hypothetical protein